MQIVKWQTSLQILISSLTTFFTLGNQHQLNVSVQRKIHVHVHVIHMI